MKRLSSVVTGSVTYLVTNLLNAAIPFALLPVLTRLLSPEQYGEVAMYQTFAGGLSAFVGVGVAAALTRRHFDTVVSSPTEEAEYTGTCIQVVLATALLVLVACIVLRPWITRFLGFGADWIPWGVATTAAGVIIQVRLAAWQVRERAFTYGMFQVTQSLANMGLSLVLVVGFALGAGGRMAAHTASMFVAAAAGLALLRRDSLLRVITWRPRFLRDILAYGLPLVPHMLASLALLYFGQVVVQTDLGLGETGIYMVAAQLAAGVSLLFDAVARAYTPWLFAHLQDGNDARNRHVVRSTYVWFLIIAVAALVVFLAGPPLISIVAGERYAKAGSVFGWLVLGQACMGMYLLLSSYLLYAGGTGLLSVVTVLSSVSYLALLVLLVRAYGLEGAGISFAAAMALRLVLTWWAAQHSRPMPWLGAFKAASV